MHEWDANLSAALILHRRFTLSPTLSLGIGPMAEAMTGFTYNLRNGNNPAQAHLVLNTGVSGVAEWQFSVFGMPMRSRLQADIPLLGLMFSPAYGQSYYEIFSLGHYDHNICVNHVFRAPQVRLLCRCC